ncbi:hypothetical protein ACJMK2_014544 [Sinanodonta woodiana]|uniref:Uncharacterized protein n=1 Tax=Sinanodonta woodiana TaxID=1069815 RepID=A0ABD3V444_SINWO
MSAEVLRVRKQLETTIQGMNTHVNEGLTKMDIIKQEKNVVKNHALNVAANKDYEYEVDEEHQDRIDISGTGKFVTNCLKCNSTCHWPCSFANDEDKEKCAAMLNGNCTVCKDKCKWNDHVNNSYRFEIRTVRVKKTYEDIKQRYVKEQAKVQTHQSLLDSITQEYKEKEMKVTESITCARESLNRLKEIALKEDPLSHVQYIELLIQNEEREKKPRFLERVKMLEAIKQQAQLLANLSDGNPLTGFLSE